MKKEFKLTRETLLTQRRELMASLKYASFIQRAVLPDPSRGTVPQLGKLR